MVAIEAGAEDLSSDEDMLEVVTEYADFAAIRDALEQAGIEMQNAELAYRPTTLVPIGEAQTRSLMKLIEALEELDDVDAVHANFDAPAEILELLAG
jgi:transcriptional/translational regulatory protein YebC/TACO1